MALCVHRSGHRSHGSTVGIRECGQGRIPGVYPPAVCPACRARREENRTAETVEGCSGRLTETADEKHPGSVCRQEDQAGQEAVSAAPAAQEIRTARNLGSLRYGREVLPEALQMGAAQGYSPKPPTLSREIGELENRHHLTKGSASLYNAQFFLQAFQAYYRLRRIHFGHFPKRQAEPEEEKTGIGVKSRRSLAQKDTLIGWHCGERVSHQVAFYFRNGWPFSPEYAKCLEKRNSTRRMWAAKRFGVTRRLEPIEHFRSLQSL